MARNPTYNGLKAGGGESSSRKSKPRTLESDFEIAMRLQEAFDNEESHGQPVLKYQGIGGGETSSGTSSSKSKMRPHDSDFRTALRLQKALDDEEGHSQPTHRDLSTRNDSSTRKGAPKHKDSSTHNDLPTHKILPTHKEPYTHKDLPTRKGLPTIKELSASPNFEGTSNHGSSRDNEYPPAIQDAIHQVQKFIATIIDKTCRVCKTMLMHSFDVGAWYQKWISAKGQPEVPSICAVPCPKTKCQALTCVGCGQKPRMGISQGKIDGFVVDWCCDQGRLFAAWALLCQYDNLELSMQEQSSRREPTDTRHSRGLQPNLAKGTGYSTSRPRYWPYDSPPGPLNFKQVDTKTDSSTKKILELTIELFPHKNSKGRPVAPTLSAMIELSLIQDRVAELLRNDSLQDATKRAGLYFAALEFFKRLGNHPNMSHLVYEERFTKKQSYGLYEISTNADFKGKGKTKASSRLILGEGDDSMTASLVSCITNLAIQSEALLSASRAVESEFRTTAGRDVLEIATHVAKLYKSMNPSSATDSKKGESSDKQLTWNEYHKKYGVARDENVFHSLTREFMGIAQAIRHSPPNRIKRLVTEVSEMATSLPPNVFVRVDEVRPDVMKCLMVGPEGTPYEGGLFEYVLCPFTA